MLALEFSTFLGRFHPLFVHLPIGFLLLAILLEWYENRKKTERKSPLIAYAWLLGGISAFAAAFCGWWLGETGLYKEDDLFSHRWLGIALVVLAFAGWWIKRHHEKHSRTVHNGFNILLLVMLFVEGHKGGNLTHGDNYLTEYAPELVQNILGISKEKDSIQEFTNPDSVLVYHNLIQPIFESKCMACHNADVKRGGFDMGTPEALQFGGEGGEVIIGGNAGESELFRRITLPQRNSKFMPPSDEALTYDEIKTVEWWISQGASFEDRVAQLTISENMKSVLLRRYHLDTEPKPWYQTVQIAPLDSTKVAALIANGFTVKSLGGNNPLLDVKYSGGSLTHKQLQALTIAKDHITWLSLAQTNIVDDWLSTISQFSNITRLQLEKTSITDTGIAHLANLEHLEALNLYGTNVTDACLVEIQKMRGLKRVYLWGTKVSSEKAKQLEDTNPELNVIVGES